MSRDIGGNWQWTDRWTDDPKHDAVWLLFLAEA